MTPNDIKNYIAKDLTNRMKKNKNKTITNKMILNDYFCKLKEAVYIKIEKIIEGE